MSGFGLDYAHETLTLTSITDWNHQASANFQLHNQRLRNQRPAGGNENRVVGRVRSPTEGSVESFDGRVVDSESANPRLCFARELAEPFDRVNLRSELRQDRRLITRAGADLEHATLPGQLKQFG